MPLLGSLPSCVTDVSPGTIALWDSVSTDSRPNLTVFFILTFRLLSKCLPLTFHGLSLGPCSPSFSFCLWFHPEFSSLVCLLSSFSHHSLPSLQNASYLYSHTGTFLLQGAICCCLFSLEASLLYGTGLFIDL